MLVEALALVIVVAIVALARRRAHWQARSKGCPTPPSRRGWPLLGNLFDLAAVLGTEWEAYIEWGKELSMSVKLVVNKSSHRSPLGSDIIYVDAMGQSIVVLNSKELADTLLEKKSLIFSSRWAIGIESIFILPSLTLPLDRQLT